MGGFIFCDMKGCDKEIKKCNQHNIVKINNENKFICNKCLKIDTLYNRFTSGYRTAKKRCLKYHNNENNDNIDHDKIVDKIEVSFNPFKK